MEKKNKSLGDMTPEFYENLGSEVAEMINKTVARANRKLNPHGLHVTIKTEFYELPQTQKNELKQEVVSES